MKKVLVALSMLAICYACGGSNEEKKPISNSENPQIGGEAKSSDTASATAPAASTAAATGGGSAAAGNGKALIEASDCRTCHKDNEKLIGPAYADVAKKYSDKDVKMLVDKVIKGGQGVWGQIPMAAHPALNPTDVEAMVKYILSMKK